MDNKFDILERIHEITSPSGLPASISFGVGVDAESYNEGYEFAALSIEMALSRGGDQAVVKYRYNFSFYGGRAKETESNANALALLYKDQFTGRNIKITDFIMVAIGINDVNTEFFQMVIAVIRAAVGHRLLICRLLIYRLLVGGLLVRGLLIGRLLVYGLLVCLLNRRRDRASASETEAGRIL